MFLQGTCSVVQPRTKMFSMPLNPVKVTKNAKKKKKAKHNNSAIEACWLHENVSCMTC